mmetsp:Transcript_20527/g.30721  ORF Transcript_20527/g.30721 Transcript_20527/m.30721 type:complete len:398 (+) Transcript_20527:329-1522(+)
MELKALVRDVEYLEQWNTVLDAGEALQTITDVYLENLIVHPNDEKYRTIKLLNIHFQERVGNVKGGIRILEDLGFTKIKYSLVYDAKIHSKKLPWLSEARLALQERLAGIAAKIHALPKRLKVDHNYQSVVGCGYFESQGPRPSMEDDHISCDSFAGDTKQGFFAVYDGHGGRGSVDFVAKSLHLNLSTSLKQNPGRAIPQHLIHAYLKTDGQLRRQNILQSGTTAVTCLVRTDGHTKYLFVGNAGDSRAVLSRKKRKAVRLTIDHKPNVPEEKKRICSLPNGFVTKTPPPRVLGYLAVSRALGDHSFKERDYVIAKPYCQSVALDAEDDVLILACDGVWDVMEDQEAIDFVHDFLDKKASVSDANERLRQASEALVKEALRRDTRDNVTVMIILLN